MFVRKSVQSKFVGISSLSGFAFSWNARCAGVIKVQEPNFLLRTDGYKRNNCRKLDIHARRSVACSNIFNIMTTPLEYVKMVGTSSERKYLSITCTTRRVSSQANNYFRILELHYVLHNA